MKSSTVALLVVAALAPVLAGCDNGGKPAAAPAPAAPLAATPPAAAPSAATPPAAAPAAAPKAAYPLTTCVVSGDTLGKMGDPVVIVRDGVEIHLCCNDCIKEIDKDPKKYESMVTAAAKK